jgi:hypothetical protein
MRDIFEINKKQKIQNAFFHLVWRILCNEKFRKMFLESENPLTDYHLLKNKYWWYLVYNAPKTARALIELSKSKKLLECKICDYLEKILKGTELDGGVKHGVDDPDSTCPCCHRSADPDTGFCDFCGHFIQDWPEWADECNN